MQSMKNGEYSELAVQEIEAYRLWVPDAAEMAVTEM